jgi:hypothetical protein
MATSPGANPYPNGMHTPWAMPDIRIASFVFINSSIGPAIYKVNSKKRLGSAVSLIRGR